MKRFHAVVVLSLVWLSGCAEDPAAWMSEVRASSEAAEAAQVAGDDERAVAQLEGLLAREAPSTVAPGDVRVLRQDAYARLGRLRLSAGDVDGAELAATRGLALGANEDVFTANLHALRGRVHEARAEDREAAAAYHRALLIHDALLERALGGE